MRQPSASSASSASSTSAPTASFRKTYAASHPAASPLVSSSSRAAQEAEFVPELSAYPAQTGLVIALRAEVATRMYELPDGGKAAKTTR
jgi:hypothetical protein